MNQWKRKRKLNSVNPIGNGGFSLIEVIIAMAVLALISLPLINYFLDSLQQSARMAKRQKATLAVQELTENIKSADFLVKENVGPGGVVNYTLENLPADLTVVGIDDSSFNHTTGRGEFIVTGTTGQFDVSIKVSTDSALNATDRGMVHGIDSTTDALLLERNQQNEALVYFTAVNTEYCAQNPGQVPLTQDEIKHNMTRTIYIKVIKNASDYTVQGYYDYSCTGLKGAGSAALTFQSTYLANLKMANVLNLYLLYDCLENGAGGLKDDTIMMSIPTSSADPDLSMGIYLVPQNLPASGSAYSMQINGCSSTDTRLDFHSNFRVADHLKVETVELTNKKPLTETGKPLRVLVITTQVFEAGHVAGDAPLATMTSMKGE